MTIDTKNLRVLAEAACKGPFRHNKDNDQIGDEWDGPVWESTCGELWSFIDGGPKENRVSYCHNCGRKVELPAAPEVKP